MPANPFRLPPAEFRARLTALALLWTMRLALWLVPFRSLLRRVERVRPARRPAADGVAGRVARSIAAASPLVPACSCLTQALAARLWLRRVGVPSRLRIGVARPQAAAAGGIEAHAWLEVLDRVLVGDRPQLDRYAALPDLPVSAETGAVGGVGRRPTI